MSEDKKIDEGTEMSEPKKKVSAKKSQSEPVRKAVMPRRTREYTFEQWARRQGVKQHHKGGLRAYVPDVERARSLEEWDACFKDY